MRTLRPGGMWWRVLFVVAAIVAAAGIASWPDTAGGASNEGTPATGSDVVFVQAADRGPRAALQQPEPLDPLAPAEPCPRIEDHVATPIPTSVPGEGILVPDGSDHHVCLAEHE